MLTRFSLGIAFLFITAPSVFAQGDWTGKTIFTKKAGVKLSPADPTDKTPPVDLTYVGYQVLQEKDGKVKIRHNAVEGWLDKAEVVVADNAVPFFNEQIKANPKDAAAFAKRALAQPQMEDAQKDLDEALRLDAKSPLVWEARGTIAFRKGDNDQAIKDLSEAIKLDPNHVSALVLRVFAEGSNKDIDAAIKDLNQVIRIDPKKADWWILRGMAYVEKRNLDQARMDFDAAIKLDPKLTLAYLSRGQLALDQKNPDAALKDFDEVLKLDFKSPEVYALRARAWSDKKDFGKAVKEWEEAIRIETKNPEYFNAFAWLLATCPDAKVRDGKRAIELGTKACELSKWKNGNDIDTLAAAYAETGQFDEAVRYQMQALQDPGLAGPAGDEYRERLELYKKKMPYREK